MRALRVAVACLLVSAPLHAGMRVRWAESGTRDGKPFSERTEALLDTGKVRLEVTTADGKPVATFLYRADQNLVYVLDGALRTVRKLSPVTNEEIRQALGVELSKQESFVGQLEGQEKEETAARIRSFRVALELGRKPKSTPSKTDSEVGGRPCRNVVIVLDAAVTRTVCLGRLDGLGVPEWVRELLARVTDLVADARRLTALQKQLDQGQPAAVDGMINPFSSPEGFPVRISQTDRGQVSWEMLLEAVEPAEVPEERFTVPKGFISLGR